MTLSPASPADTSGALPGILIRSAPQDPAEYYLDFAERAIPFLKGWDHRNLVDELEHDVDNLEAALKWCVSHEPARGLRVATDLWDFWSSRGFARKGRDAIGSLLPAASKEPVQYGRAAMVEYSGGYLSRHIGDFDRAAYLIEQSRGAFLNCDDFAGAAGALRQLGILEWHRNPKDLARAQAFLDDAL